MSNRKARPDMRKAALVFFREDMSNEEIEQQLDSIRGVFTQTPRIQEYDANWGHPTFYIP